MIGINMGLGIHNNSECVRCGACCVYFAIFGDSYRDRTDKTLNKPCTNLAQGDVNTCIIYESRPLACKSFFCGNVDERVKGCLKQTLAMMAQTD